MEADIKALEEKITKLVGLCASLRNENQDLRSQLDSARAEADKLKSDMRLASDKLEVLLESLPQDMESA
jgi:cell division protein ZapB